MKQNSKADHSSQPLKQVEKKRKPKRIFIVEIIKSLYPTSLLMMLVFYPFLFNIMLKNLKDSLVWVGLWGFSSQLFGLICFIILTIVLVINLIDTRPKLGIEKIRLIALILLMLLLVGLSSSFAEFVEKFG